MRFGEIRSINWCVPHPYRLNMKHILRIIIVVGIVLAVSLGLWAYLNGYLSRSKASTEMANVRFSKGLIHAQVGDEVVVEIILSTASSTNTNSGISGVDIRFTDTGNNLDFMMGKTTATLPTGFDASIFDPPTGTPPVPNHISRLAFVSKKPTSDLQKSIVIPLYFKVVGTGSLSSSVMVDATNSLVVGPPGLTYPVVVDSAASSFGVTSAEVSPTTGTTPTAVQPTGDANATTVPESTNFLYINSIASYPAPFRYEQPIKLEKGTYHLTLDAKVYVRRGRGMVVALMVGNQVFYVTPPFPAKADFSEFTDTVTITDAVDNKQMLLRIYCEDGSECEVNKISLEDAWGSERVINSDFADVQQMIDPRKQPTSWEVDSTANLYGSVDPAFGHNGSLMINNSAK